MKLLTLACALCASVASAQTGVIEASSAPTFCLTECWPAPNNAGIALYWSTPSIYGGVTVGINGHYYSADISKYPTVITSYENLVLTDTAGNAITVSAIWNTGRRCGGGRAGGCANVYELVSGSVIL